MWLRLSAQFRFVDRDADDVMGSEERERDPRVYGCPRRDVLSDGPPTRLSSGTATCAVRQEANDSAALQAARTDPTDFAPRENAACREPGDGNACDIAMNAFPARLICKHSAMSVASMSGHESVAPAFGYI